MVGVELPKRDDQTTVNHKDNDPTNNRLENLHWATQKEQIHSYDTNLTRESSAMRRSKPIEGRLFVRGIRVFLGEHNPNL